MKAAEFIAKWRRVELKERSAAHEHFLDLCRLVDHPTPAAIDPTGEQFCFEKGAAKYRGGGGFADVWKKDFFGWEYKGKHKDLGDAYDQLLRYRDALANPPLLVVSDMHQIRVHTNFTGTVSVCHEIPLTRLGEPREFEVLSSVFFEPEKLKPGRTSAAITSEAAEKFAGLAEALRARGIEPGKVAHFLNRLVFCLFAEDIGLLPEMVLSAIVKKAGEDPRRFGLLLGQLFEAMATGGDFGVETIRHFNGNLFDDASVPRLIEEDLDRISAVAKLDWAAVDPSIFGTLFERGLDPSKRSQLGVHYTSREDIETLVEPVVMQPLRREWEETKRLVESVLATGRKDGRAPKKPLAAGAARKARAEADSLLHQFLLRLQAVKVLDPACGSGNFLYVTLQKLKSLEKEVSVYATAKGFQEYLPAVGPWQLYGIELNPYAHDLAQTSIWIGFIQWTRANGYQVTQNPILRSMAANFRCGDAILDLSDPEHPREPDWPKVDFIVGNPPFLGGKMLRRELGDAYVDQMFTLWKGRVPAEADLCAYWFEKARTQIEKGGANRAGLLATQGIRGGANREVLKRIKETGDIFWAESDRPWVLDGANVHVSMVAFDNGEEKTRVLDGKPVATINPNLSTAADTTSARPIPANANVAFMGTTKGGAFDISEELALKLLRAPNPHGKPNSDVVVPWVNGMDLTRRSRGMWIVDFGVGMAEAEAARHELPFAHLHARVKPEREQNKRESYRRLWWQQVEARPAMRQALARLPRFLATLSVSKHRLFAWMTEPTQPDHQLFAFARSDDFFFGVLHSRVHEVWALKQGTRLETRPRYTPTTCFETFPFPSPTKPQEAAIAAAAKELNALRERWLNPPEWTREEVLEFPATFGGPWDRFIEKKGQGSGVEGQVGLARYPRLVPKDARSAVALAKRTLTNLYNERPQWLADAHRQLDEAVFAAYGWPAELSDAALLEKLLERNRELSGTRPK